jgi:hypothetical protein
VLRDAGVITCEKRGKEVWCTVQTGEVAQILRDLADALGPAGRGAQAAGHNVNLAGHAASTLSTVRECPDGRHGLDLEP